MVTAQHSVGKPDRSAASVGILYTPSWITPLDADDKGLISGHENHLGD
jgi:hypothetical protein